MPFVRTIPRVRIALFTHATPRVYLHRNPRIRTQARSRVQFNIQTHNAFKHTTPPPRDWNLAFAHAKAFPRVSDGRDGRSHPRVSVHARKPPGV